MDDISHTAHLSATTPTVKDPVCGMDVDPSGREHVSEHDGQTFHFCSGHSKAKFDGNPPYEEATAPRFRWSVAMYRWWAILGLNQ